MDDLFSDDIDHIDILGALRRYSFLDISNLHDGSISIKSNGLDIIYYPVFFPKDLSKKIYDYMIDGVPSDSDNEGMYGKNIKWERRSVSMYGKKGFLARLVSWYADEEKDYIFSRVRFKGNKWNEQLLYIKKKIEDKLRCDFNSVLLNYYRGGDDYISWHTDAEKSLGLNPKIASVSFGATRIFKLRLESNNKICFSVPLFDGSLLFMRGETQHLWQHAIDKQQSLSGRVNLTFRTIL